VARPMGPDLPEAILLSGTDDPRSRESFSERVSRI
jgi:hypothetical protein